MTPVDILGWIATAIVVVSFAVKDMFMLRVINVSGTVLWLIYGSLKHDYPVLTVNILIAIAHIIWFYSQVFKKKKKRKKKTDKPVNDPTDIYFQETEWLR